MTSKAAEILANALEKDVEAFNAGDVNEVGMRIDAVLNEVRPMNNIPKPIFKLALQFWKEWALFSRESSRHKAFVTNTDWPIMAHTIAQHVRLGTLPNDKLIIDNFVRKPPIRSWLKLKSLINRSNNT
jgi:hypothetical protein